MRSTLLFSLFCCSLLTPTAHAESGDFLLRLGPAYVVPNDESEEIPGFDGSEIGVDSAFTLGLSLGYMITDNIGVELLGVIPPAQHDLEGARSIDSLGTIGRTRVLPPTLTVNYHFNSRGDIRPYVGVGANYTLFFDEEPNDTLEDVLGDDTELEIDSTFGYAFHAGVDMSVTENIFLNGAIWYINIEPEATIRAGGSRIKVDVDINPWVFMIGAGIRF